jgi:hypothetical protein
MFLASFWLLWGERPPPPPQCCFEGVKKTTSKDGVVRLIHVHHIESYVLSASVKKATRRYW